MTRLKQLREMRKGYLDKISGACAEAGMWEHICTGPWLTWPQEGRAARGWLRTPPCTPLTHEG